MHSPKPSPLALAIAWVSRIMTISLAMVVPAIAGSWLDARLGTGWLGPAGLVIGFAGGLSLLVALAKSPRRGEKS